VQPSGGDIAAFSIPVLIPLIVLAVPLVDVGLAIYRRLRRGRAVFAPDKQHIHHQLQQIGHTHRQAVLLMYFWSLLLAGAALTVTFVNGRLVVGTIAASALFLILLSFLPGGSWTGTAGRWRPASPRPSGASSPNRASGPSPPEGADPGEHAPRPHVASLLAELVKTFTISVCSMEKVPSSCGNGEVVALTGPESVC
jgi:UDP-GlcNAc:undecaprenyl-phosphate GlcNAc-1-phosphate transferase